MLSYWKDLQMRLYLFRIRPSLGEAFVRRYRAPYVASVGTYLGRRGGLSGI